MCSSIFTVFDLVQKLCLWQQSNEYFFPHQRNGKMNLYLHISREKQKNTYAYAISKSSDLFNRGVKSYYAQNTIVHNNNRYWVYNIFTSATHHKVYQNLVKSQPVITPAYCHTITHTIQRHQRIVFFHADNPFYYGSIGAIVNGNIPFVYLFNNGRGNTLFKNSMFGILNKFLKVEYTV